MKQAVSRLGDKTAVTLLTRTLLMDFASKASNLEALRALAKRNGYILSLSSLHAKVYVIDDKRALITSANATYSGMNRNRECGYQLTDSSEIRTLRKMLLAGFGSSPRPQLWTAQDLDELSEPVEKLRAALPKPVVLPSADIEAPRRVELRRRDYARVLTSFSGWLQLTLEGIGRKLQATPAARCRGSPANLERY